MFTNTQAKGFRMKFANGWAISVQWGPGNYCDNYREPFEAWHKAQCGESMITSRTAECAVLSPDGKVSHYWGKRRDTVKGYMTVDEVAKLISAVSRRKASPGKP
jgi:hypothetical protein